MAPKLELLAVTNHVYMMCAIALRCWRPLQQYPFRAAKLSPRFPEHIRKTVSAELRGACPDCLDHFGCWAKRNGFDVEGAQGVLEGTMQTAICQVFAKIPITHLQTEDSCIAVC